MMHKIAIALAAAVIATSGLTLGGSARIVTRGGGTGGATTAHPNRGTPTYLHPHLWHPWTRLGDGGI
jgi:hypothetical protein